MSLTKTSLLFLSVVILATLIDEGRGRTFPQDSWRRNDVEPFVESMMAGYGSFSPDQDELPDNAVDLTLLRRHAKFLQPAANGFEFAKEELTDGDLRRLLRLLSHRVVMTTGNRKRSYIRLV